MTRRTFQLVFAAVATVYSLLVATGIAYRENEDLYKLFKDLLPLATALPAAMLAGAYQRRSSFLQQLRTTWTGLLDAVQDAIQFTHRQQPSHQDFSLIMKKLSVATDDFRSLYKNLREDEGTIGYFPFESLKKIQADLAVYYLAGDFAEDTRKATRGHVIDCWKRTRSAVLQEFDRAQPTYSDTPFA